MPDNDQIEEPSAEDLTLMKEDEADAAKAAEQSADATSSSAEDASKPAPKDTLSIVRDVIGKSDEAVASSAEKAEDVEPSTTDQETTKADAPDDYSDVPFNKHPRFQAVLSKLRESEADAGRYRNVENFIAQQGLAAEEAADLLRIGGLMKTNPVEAWEAMRPKVEQVMRAAGILLPDDLKQRVAAGQLDPDTAQEISRHRATVQSMEARTQFETQRAAEEGAQRAAAQIQTTVSSWEADRRLKDPNFEAKMPALQKEIAWLQTMEGRPHDPMGVQAQLQKAYDAVTASYVAPRPARPKPAMTPVTGGQVSGAVTPAKPRSTLEIVQAEIAKRTA